MVSIPFDSYSSGADNIPTTGVFTLSQCRGLFWVRYVIVRLCSWWRLCQACFAAHSPKDATSSDLNEQQTLDYYDSVGRSLRCWNRWNGTTKTETAAEEEQMKCTSFMHAVCREVSSIGSLAPSIRWAPRLVTSRDTQCNGHFSRPRFAAFKMYPLLQRISNVLKRYCHDCLVSGDSSDVHFSQLKTRLVMSFNLSESPWRKPMFQKGRKGAYFYLETAKVVDGDRKHIPMSSETRLSPWFLFWDLRPAEAWSEGKPVDLRNWKRSFSASLKAPWSLKQLLTVSVLVHELPIFFPLCHVWNLRFGYQLFGCAVSDGSQTGFCWGWNLATLLLCCKFNVFTHNQSNHYYCVYSSIYLQ